MFLPNLLSFLAELPTPVGRSAIQILSDGHELFEGGLQVFDDAGGQRAGGWQVVGVFEAFVAQPEKVEAELVAFEQVFVAEGVETLAFLALVTVFGVVMGYEVVEVDTGEFLKSGGSAYCMKCGIY